MASSGPKSTRARVAQMAIRLRNATSASEVLALTAEEARQTIAAKVAAAARVSGRALDGAVLVPAGDDAAPADAQGPSADPPAFLATALAAVLQADASSSVVRAGAVVAVALRGSGDALLGLVAAPLADERDDAATKAEAALAQVADVASLALAAAVERERAASANRAREILLASVSHDLRNPLNTFAMSSGLLKDDLERNDVDAKRGLALLARMERAQQRMQALIEDLLEASKVEARRIDFAMRAENASDVVTEAVAVATKAASDRGPTVTKGDVDPSAKVVVDRARTAQLLAKVVTYASKSTGDAGSVVLSAARSGDVVHFRAQAAGPGGAALTAPEEGRGGLALLMARGLAELQRGALRVEPGTPLVVTVTFPVAG